MIISIGAENALDKIQHTFLTFKKNKNKRKPLSKWEIEGDLFDLIKAIYKKPNSNAITEYFPSKIKKR